MITPNYIDQYLLNHYDDLMQIDAWGEKSYFYNPHQQKTRGAYFCTIKEKDGDNDKASHLARNNVYRLNLCITRAFFLEQFKVIPQRPSKGGVISGPYDFTELNTLMPHPVYGWMCWVAISNPDKTTFSKIKVLINESYQLAKTKFQKG